MALPNYSEYTFQQNSVDVQATGAFALAGRKHEAVVGLSGTRSREHKSGHARVGDLAGTGDFNEWDNLAKDPKYSAIKADLAKWLPKIDKPPVPGSKSRVLTFEPITGEAIWEDQPIDKTQKLPEP